MQTKASVFILLSILLTGSAKAEALNTVWIRSVLEQEQAAANHPHDNSSYVYSTTSRLKSLNEHFTSARVFQEYELEKAKVQKLMNEISGILVSTPEIDAKANALQKRNAKIAHYEAALVKMRQLPRSSLIQYKTELETFAKYKGANDLNNDAMVLLTILESPEKKELPGVNFPQLEKAKTVVGRSDEPVKTQERSMELMDNYESFKKLLIARNTCHAASKTQIEAFKLRATDELSSEVSAYKTAKATHEADLEKQEKARAEIRFNALERESKKTGKTNIINAAELIELLIEGNKKGASASIVTDFILSKKQGKTDLQVPAKIENETQNIASFEALGKKQDLFKESLDDNKDDEFMFTLTEKGQKWFSKALNADQTEQGKSGFAFTKVAANQLKALDNIWQNTIDHVESAKKDPELKKLSDSIAATEKSLADLTAKHQSKTKKIEDALAKLDSCYKDHTNLETELYNGVDKIHSYDSQYRSTPNSRLHDKTFSDELDGYTKKFNRLRGSQKEAVELYKKNVPQTEPQKSH